MSESSPIDEARQETAQPSRFPRHWVILGLLVLAHAALAAWLNPFGMSRGEVGEMQWPLVAGVLFSQPILFAFGGSFVVGKFYIRLPLFLLLLCLIACVAEIGLIGHDTHGMVLKMDLIHFAVATLAFFPLRRSSRWRLKQSTSKPAQAETRTLQFTTKHVLIFTTIVAVVCGGLRTLYILDPGAKRLLAPADIITGIGLPCCLFYPVFTIPWFVLLEPARRVVSVFIAMVIWIVLNLAVSCSMAVSTLVISPPDPYRDVLPPLLMLGLGSGLSAVITTLVLRFCGFRMIREPKPQA
jgi:hypothetical protein